MKKWMKTAAAAFIGAALCTAAGSITASADVEQQGDTLILSGNVTVGEVQAYANNEAVKKVVCEPGTVFPEDSSLLFFQFKYTESIDLSNADTSQVTNMRNMFDNCTAMKSLVLGNFNTEKVEDMSAMFWFCRSLESIDLSSFNTSNVCYAPYMFRYCDSLETLDLSTFDFSQVSDVQLLFSYCDELKTIYVSDKWNLNAEAKDESMFWGCRKLVGENGTAYNENNVNMEYARIDGKDGQPGYFTFSGNYVKGASLSLDGTIGVNFYTNLTAKAAKAVLSGPNGEQEITDLAAAKQEDGSYKFSYGVSAIQAGEKVTLKIYDADGKQLDLYNSSFALNEDKSVSFSVRDYIDSYTDGENEKLNALVAALDNYCKAAENNFGVNSYDLDIPEADFSAYKPTKNGSDEAKFALILNSGTDMRFTYTGPYTGEDCVIYNGSILTAEGNYYYFRNIPAHLLGNGIALEIGTTTYSNFSALSYGYYVMQSSDDANLKTLVNALYAYAIAAKDYRAAL